MNSIFSPPYLSVISVNLNRKNTQKIVSSLLNAYRAEFDINGLGKLMKSSIEFIVLKQIFEIYINSKDKSKESLEIVLRELFIWTSNYQME